MSDMLARQHVDFLLPHFSRCDGELPVLRVRTDIKTCLKLFVEL